MNRALILLLLLGLLGGAAWLLISSGDASNNPGGESPFDFDEEEGSLAPGTEPDPGRLERAEAGAEAGGDLSDQAAAPSEIQTAFEKSTLRGRHVDAQGAPLRAPPFTLLEIGDKFATDSQIEPSETGEFLAPLQQPEDQAPASWLCLQARSSKDPMSFLPNAWVFARKVDPVTHLQDLGDLVAGSGPTALAGIVTDLDRRPLSGAQVEVMWSPAGSRRSSGVFVIRTGADGRFRFLGTWPDLGKWQVRADHPDYLSASLPVAPGAANVELLLTRGSALRGRILVDPDISLERLTVRIRARRDEHANWEQNKVLQPDPKTGEFAATGLFNGWGRIRVYDREMKWNLHFQYGIPLPAGLDAQVAELQPLDLRGRLKNFKLTVLQPDGSLAKDLAIVTRTKDKGRKWDIPNPLACVVPSSTIEFRVTAAGCREQIVFVTGAEQTIRLLPSPIIAFQLGRQPRLEEGFSLSYTLNGAEKTGGHWRLEFDADGRAQLPLSPGSYVVTATLNRKVSPNGSIGANVHCGPEGEDYLRFVIDEDGQPANIRIEVDPKSVQERMQALLEHKQQ
jgi:hypothetical protein